MPPVDDSPESTLNARRKLVRGALAAPTLLTLYSGSAFAAASHLRCLVNANAGPNPADAPAGLAGQDAYARVQLRAVVTTTAPIETPPADPASIEPAPGDPVPIGGDKKPKPPKKVPDGGSSEAPAETTEPPELLNGTTTTYFALGTDLGAFKRRGLNVPLDGQAQQFDPDNSYAKIDGIVAAPPDANNLPLSGKFVLVRFDAEGFIVDLGGGSDGAIIANSCLTSATPFIV